MSSRKVSNLVRVFQIMSDGIPRTGYDVCKELELRFGIKISDSSATARIRELRNANRGANSIPCKKHPVTGVGVYQMTLPGTPPPPHR